jgi:hypothetical protein
MDHLCIFSPANLRLLSPVSLSLHQLPMLMVVFAIVLTMFLANKDILLI